MMTRDQNKVKMILTCSTWSVVLSILSVIPHQFITNHLGHLDTNASFDAGHVTGYAILAFLLITFFSDHKALFAKFTLMKKPVGATLLLILFWGSLNEALQMCTKDRCPDYVDIGWNLTGAAMGILLFLVFNRRKAVEIETAPA